MENFNIKIADIATLHGIACALPFAARQGSAEDIDALQARAAAIGGDPKRLARIKRMVSKIRRGATEADLDAMAATWRKHQMLDGNPK